MVRVEGVAPSRLSALVPKTSVSTYFTTRGWHVVQVLPPARSDLEFVLRKLAPDMLKKKCDRRESHPDHLVGNEIVCCLTYDRKSQKEQTPTESKLCTAGHFPLAVFQALQEARTPLKTKNPTHLLSRVTGKIFSY
jgi:hypothetical protein